MDVNENKEKSLDEEQVKATTPVTETKIKEEKRRNEGGEEKEEEEDQDARKRDEEVVHPSPKMQDIWNFVENNSDHKSFVGVRKSVNLEKNGPKWNEEARREAEKESFKNLLLTMRDKIKEFVVNHAVEHTVTFFDHNEIEITSQLSLLKFVDRFLEKVEAYEGGRMSPLLVEQCESFLNFLIECRSYVDVDCVINVIDDTFGSAEMMKLFLTMMQELVDWQDRKVLNVKFSEENTRNLKEALGFMKVFEDTGDEKVRKYCCILMFFILTTDVYVENMRRASWLQALQKKSIYLENKRKGSMRKSEKKLLRRELDLLGAILRDTRLCGNKVLFDEIANVIGFVFNTGKVFHLMSKAFDEVYKNEYSEDEKLKFFTNLLKKVSFKCMDKANEKALAGNIDKTSTSCKIKRNANVVVITPLHKFKTFISDEEDKEMQYFWRFVLCTVGPRETFLSDQLAFDMAFSCRDLRVKQKETNAGNNAKERREMKKRERKTARAEEMWLKNAKNFYNLGHVNASTPPASGSNRPGHPVAFHLNYFVPYVFSGTEMGVKKEAKNTEEKETEGRAEVVNKEEEEEDKEEEEEDKDDDVEFLYEVIIIGDDEEEEVKEEVEEEGKEGDREKKEERNEECEEVARTQRHYYLTMFFSPQLKENSICVAHAMHGMRLIGILRCANGGTLEWGKGTRKGEQNEEVLVQFMKSMLGQMSDYYARIQNKFEEAKHQA
jgi:hypothetical protein